MAEPFPKKDNEFIAWYPSFVSPEDARHVWERHRAAYYVHIPFCDAICDYCGFAVERRKEGDIDGYLSALHDEIRQYARSGRLSSYRFECGHFGGGTPSAISGEQLVAIKQAIDSGFDVSTSAEVTVEVNPISFGRDKAKAYAEAGINRVSVGVQSFDDRSLRTIGRPHRARDVIRTLEVIHDVGFENYSLDLIYGIPGQSLESLRADLSRAVATGATHLSCFRVEIIPFTVLSLREATGGLPPRLSVARLNEMDDLVSTVLTEGGYRNYGAFNFAKPGYESVHNEIAFVAPQGEYVGFGNSAYSFVNGHIYTNHAMVSRYIEEVRAERPPIALARRLTAHEQMSRYFVLGVKFFRVSRSGFTRCFGLEPEFIFGPVLERLAIWDMLVCDGDDYVLTARGRHFVNNVAKEFYVGPSRGVRQHAQFVPTLTPARIEFFARKVGLAGANEGS